MATALKRTPLAWLSVFLTLILLVLTTLYASQTALVSKGGSISSSRSNAIFVLRALSELTGVMLAATIAGAFERVQWLFVVGDDGTPLTHYLALQAGTGVFGLLVLALGGVVPRMKTRMWSGLRLVSIVLVPVLGVLIMSKSPLFRIRVAFSRRDRHASEIQSWSVGNRIPFLTRALISCKLTYQQAM